MLSVFSDLWLSVVGSGWGIIARVLPRTSAHSGREALGLSQPKAAQLSGCALMPELGRGSHLPPEELLKAWKDILNQETLFIYLSEVVVSFLPLLGREKAVISLLLLLLAPTPLGEGSGSDSVAWR